MASRTPRIIKERTRSASSTTWYRWNWAARTRWTISGLIWPQCGPNQVTLAKRYFKQKDMVESYLANQVKTGRMDLGKAQAATADDWTQFAGAAANFCSQNPKKCGGGH